MMPSHSNTQWILYGGVRHSLAMVGCLIGVGCGGQSSLDSSETNGGSQAGASAIGTATHPSGGSGNMSFGGMATTPNNGGLGALGANTSNATTNMDIGGAASVGGTTASILHTGGGTATGGTASMGGNTEPGAPAITDSGYVTVSAGTVVLSGFVSSYVGGSGSSISLTYDASSFCASGTVGANATYNSWAGAGFNVNQTNSGSSGSTSLLALNGTMLDMSYANPAGSTLELQLWDGSDYWCYRLPAASSATTVSIPFSSLNTKCWDDSGTAFTSGTSITTVQLVVPGSAATSTPFNYCFLGLKVK
jgi:hypothetical protein